MTTVIVNDVLDLKRQITSKVKDLKSLLNGAGDYLEKGVECSREEIGQYFENIDHYMAAIPIERENIFILLEKLIRVMGVSKNTSEGQLFLDEINDTLTSTPDIVKGLESLMSRLRIKNLEWIVEETKSLPQR